jgi:amidase
MDLVRWVAVASLTGLPATVAPVGRTNENLPIGIQCLGPYLEDATPIEFSALLKSVAGGFEPPPGY